MVRFILTLVIVLAVANLSRADDKAIIAEVKKTGVSCEVYYGRTYPPIISIKLDENCRIDTVLSLLCELNTDLSIDADQLSDAQLSQICALPRLRVLCLKHCSMTEGRLKSITKARNLRTLFLESTSITDEGLAEISHMPRIDYLALGETNVTDAGLKHLEEMRGLTCLSLRGCPGVTDVGLKHLEALHGLKDVYLGGCPGVTDAGVKRLQSALPKCSVRK